MDRATRGILVGMILGDGYVNVRNRFTQGKYYFQSSELRILHSLTQMDYCQHKAGLLRKLLNRNHSVTVVANGPGSKYKAAQFSVSHPYFKQLKRWCYPGGVKTFTMRVLKMLTPEGIAFWYMDDGSARVNINKEGLVSSVATDIATMCSESEAHTIKEYFQDEHGIKFNIRCRKKSPPEKAFYVQANTEASKDFAFLVRPWIIPSMTYKLRHVADLGLHECRASVGNCANCDNPIYDNRHNGLCPTCYSRKYYREIRRFSEERKPSKHGFYKDDEIVRPYGKSEP